MANGFFRSGTVFELSPSGSGWNFSPLYAFSGGSDGGGPEGGLLLDATGKLFGMTKYGGIGYNSYLGPPPGMGVVSEITP